MDEAAPEKTFGLVNKASLDPESETVIE